MTRLPLWLLAASLIASPATAQFRGARSADYLFGASALGARALWVNPAAQGTLDEASIMLEGLIERDAAGDYPFSQFTIGFNSRGLGFGFRRDLFPGDAAGNTWRVGVGRRLGSLAIGAGVSLYSGPDTRQAVDLGVWYRPAPSFTLAVAVENIGQPVVRDSSLRFGGTAGINWTPLQGALGVDLEARGSHDVAGGVLMAYRGGIQVRLGSQFPLALQGVLALDDGFGDGHLLLGLSFGGASHGGIVAGGRHRDGASTLSDLSAVLEAGKRFR
jgi:hypothetical protein